MKHSMLLKKRVNRPLSLAVIATFAAICSPSLGWAGPLLGSAQSFAVLGASAVTNASDGGAAATMITGDLGSSAGLSSITGFPPGTVTGGTIQPGTEAAAHAALTSAYNSLGALAVTGLIPAGGLSGASLTPGVYAVTSTAVDLTATLTLDGTSSSSPGLWVFLMSSSLITASDTKVAVGTLDSNDSVYWVVRSAATLGDNTDFAGNILALDQIAFNPGATDLCGRALSRTALVSFAGVGTTIAPGETEVEANKVGGGCGSSNGLSSTAIEIDSGGSVVDTTTGEVVAAAAPEPGTLALLAFGLAGLMGFARRQQ